MPEKYHCFWTAPVGGEKHYLETDDFKKVNELAVSDADDHSNVRDLVVIEGRRIGFKPETVTTVYAPFYVGE